VTTVFDDNEEEAASECELKQDNQDKEDAQPLSSVSTPVQTPSPSAPPSPSPSTPPAAHTSSAQAPSPATIEAADTKVKEGTKGSTLKSGRAGKQRSCASIATVSVCAAFGHQSGRKTSSYLPSKSVDECIARVKSFKKPFSLAPFFVLVKIVAAPSKDSWTRAACADPYNRQCQAWLVCFCFVFVFVDSDSDPDVFVARSARGRRIG